MKSPRTQIVCRAFALSVLLIVPLWSQAPENHLRTQSNSLQSLSGELDRVRGQLPGQMSIYMKHLTSGEEIALDSDTVYETFSVIKLAIAAELMHQAESGKFSLSDRIETRAADQRLPSGVLYGLEPGLNPTVRDLLTLMIVISDNEATDL